MVAALLRGCEAGGLVVVLAVGLVAPAFTALAALRGGQCAAGFASVSIGAGAS
jgi:hypothetical protein